MKTYQKRVGNTGEQLAAKHLSHLGYQLLDQNFSTRYGEIDLIALDKDVIVFVEVKTRTSDTFGAPEDSITPTKLNKIINTGLLWLQDHPEAPEDWRIDVMAVLIDQNKDLLDLHHFINANL